MANWTAPLRWDNEGKEPSVSLKQSGFSAGYLPPVETFNYFLHNQQVCIEELQQEANSFGGVGKSLYGVSVIPYYEATAVVAKQGAEIFNDLSDRVYDNFFKDTSEGNLAVMEYSHAEGGLTTAVDEYSHAEGWLTLAGVTIGTSRAAHVEGNTTKAQGHYVHAEGYSTKALVNNAHVEGFACTAESGETAHAEGSTTAAGNNAHAEGSGTKATGVASHVEGSNTKAIGINSTACGSLSQAKEAQSLATGYWTLANASQAVFGVLNKELPGAKVRLGSSTGGTGTPFIVGVGTSTSARSNGFRVDMNGRCYGQKSFLSSGADYAEFFEWMDSNPKDEDRRGLFVTLDGDLIRKANADDDYILGVVSANPSVLGNCYADEWQGKYITDVFGEPVLQTVDIPEETKIIVEKVVNDEGEIIIPEETETIPAHTIETYIISPDYDPTQQYVSREDRQEWDAIGTHGQLVIVDDGTCEVNGYCTVKYGGLGTASATKTPYRVMERLDNSHISVYIR